MKKKVLSKDQKNKNPRENLSNRKKYSVPYKKKIVQEYLCGLKTSLSIHEEYGINFSLLCNWKKWYENHFLNFKNDYPIMKTKKTEDKVKILELQKELARMKLLLKEEKLHSKSMEHLIKLAKKYHDIDLKKSIGKK